MALKKILIDRANVSSPVVQTQFMGATILNFDSRLGWGADSSEVTIQLVEDKSSSTKRRYNNFGGSFTTNSPDSFSPGALGSPQVFRYGSFSYGGLLENWEKNSSMSGHTYSARLRSPTKILQNAKIITTGLDDAFTASPNLINIHQEAGFESWCNDVGITWTDIKSVIQGWTFNYRGYNYQLNVSEIPECNIRFDGDVLSVMDAINRAASAQALRIFVDLTVSGGTSMIGVHSHSGSSFRASAVSPTAQAINIPDSLTSSGSTIGLSADQRLEKSSIYRAVGNGPLGLAGASPASATIGNIITSISTGIESTDVSTQSVVNGEFEHRIFRLEEDGSDGDGDSSSTEIRQYWGEDPETGEALVSEPKTSAGGLPMGEAFSVKTSGQSFSHLELGEYEISELELRAAEESFESWNHFMIAFKPDVLKKITGNDETPQQPWLSEEIVNFLKTGETDDDDDDDDDATGASSDFSNYQKKYIEQLNKEKEKAPALQQVHQFVTSFGSYYGQQYFVSLPQLDCCDSAIDIEVNQSYEQTDGGWPEDDLEADILGLHMTSDPGLELFKTDNGKVGPILKYDGGNCVEDDEKIDVGRLSGTWYNKGGQNGKYWLQASFDKIIGHPEATGDDPKCSTQKNPGGVLSSAGVKRVPDVGGNSNEVDGLGMALFKFIIEEEASEVLTDEEGESLRELLEENLIASNWRGLGLAPEPCKPVAAAVPLKSNRLSYGPWYSPIWNTKGEAKYRRETSLTPWTFGSYADMEEAGEAVVATDCSNQTEQESGSMKFAGLPSSIFGTGGGLGSSLQGYGANCTSIAINFGIGGLTTSLQFRTFVRNFGELASEKLKWMQTISEAENKFQRAFNQKTAEKENKELVKQFRSGAGATEGTPGGKNSYSSGAKTNPLNRFKNSKASNVMVSVNDNAKPSIHIMPAHEVIEALGPATEDNDKWEKLHIAGLESLFRPVVFSATELDDEECDVRLGGSNNKMYKEHPLSPWLESGEQAGVALGSSPMTDRESYGVNILTTGDQMSDKGLKSDDLHDDVRGFALRGPIVISGFGYDFHRGGGVPGAGYNAGRGPVDGAVGSDIKKEIVAPLDLRYDAQMGVWTTPKYDPFMFAQEDPRRPKIPGRQYRIELMEDWPLDDNDDPEKYCKAKISKFQIPHASDNPLYWVFGYGCLTHSDDNDGGYGDDIEIQVYAADPAKYKNAKEGDKGTIWWDGANLYGESLADMCEFYRPSSFDCYNYANDDKHGDYDWVYNHHEIDEWLHETRCMVDHSTLDTPDTDCAEAGKGYTGFTLLTLAVGETCGIDEEHEAYYPCHLNETYGDSIRVDGDDPSEPGEEGDWGFDVTRRQFLVHRPRGSEPGGWESGGWNEEGGDDEEGEILWETSQCEYIHEDLKRDDGPPLYPCSLLDTYDGAHTMEYGGTGGGGFKNTENFDFHQDRNQALMHTKGGNPGPHSSAEDLKESKVRWGTLQNLAQTYTADEEAEVHKYFPPVLEMTYKMDSSDGRNLPGLDYTGFNGNPYEGWMGGMDFGFDPMKAQVLAHKAYKDGDETDNSGVNKYKYKDSAPEDHPAIVWGDPLELACPIHNDDQSDFPCYIHSMFKGAKNTDGDGVVGGTLDDFGFENDTPQAIIHIPQNDNNDVASLRWGEICNITEDTQERLPCYLGQTYRLENDQKEGGDWNKGGFGFDAEKNQILTHTGSEDDDAKILWKDFCNIPEDVAEDFPCTLEDTYGGAFPDADGKDLGYDKDIKQVLGHEEGEPLEWMEDTSSCLIPEGERSTWPCSLEEMYKGSDGEYDNATTDFGFVPGQDQVLGHLKKSGGASGGPGWLPMEDMENCRLDSSEQDKWLCSLEYSYKGAANVTSPRSEEDFGWDDEDIQIMVGTHDTGTRWVTAHNVKNITHWPNTLESMYNEVGGNNQVKWGKNGTMAGTAADNSVQGGLASGNLLDKDKTQVIGHEKNKGMGWLEIPECPIKDTSIDNMPCYMWHTFGGVTGIWKGNAAPPEAKDYGFYDENNKTPNQILAHGPDVEEFALNTPGNTRDLGWAQTLTHQIRPNKTTEEFGNIPTYISNTLFGDNGLDPTKYSNYNGEWDAGSHNNDHGYDTSKNMVLVSKGNDNAALLRFEWEEFDGGGGCDITDNNQVTHPCHLWQTYKGAAQASIDDLQGADLNSHNYNANDQQVLSHSGGSDDKIKWIDFDGAGCDITETSEPPVEEYPCTIGDLHPQSTSEANGKNTFKEGERQFLGHNPTGSDPSWPDPPPSPSVHWMELYGVEKGKRDKLPPTLEHTYKAADTNLGNDTFGFDDQKVQILGHNKGQIKWITVKDCDDTGSGD